MINLAKPIFWGVALLVILGVRVARMSPARRPQLFFAATALLMCASGGVWALSLLLLVGLYGYLALGSSGPRSAAWAHAVVMSAAFVGSQYAAPLTADLPKAAQIFPLIGLPYVYLRWLHLLVEIRQGTLSRPPLLRYFAYLLPFHQLLAGPIERYPAFEAQLDSTAAPLNRSDILKALDRVTTGLMKSLVFCHLLKQSFGFEFTTTGLVLLLEIYLYAWYLYLDFSGYMDMMIGVGQLIGWRPPENFNWPYLRRNMIVFWEHWHISLSEWIRDYIFTPSNMSLQRGHLRGRPLLAGVLSYLIAMVLCGLWHRANLQFLVWGLLHGAGIVVCKIYGTMLRKRLGKKRYKAYIASPVSGVIATFITFTWVAVSFLFAFHSPGRALEILGQLL